VTYEEHQAFGALAGWPRCGQCNRYFQAEQGWIEDCGSYEKIDDDRYMFCWELHDVSWLRARKRIQKRFGRSHLQQTYRRHRSKAKPGISALASMVCWR
jgi:hypothetical protein